MDSNFVDSIEKMLLADQKANEALSEGMRQIVKAINANRTAFSIKNKIIEEDIGLEQVKSGADRNWR